MTELFPQLSCDANALILALLTGLIAYLISDLIEYALGNPSGPKEDINPYAILSFLTATISLKMLWKKEFDKQVLVVPTFSKIKNQDQLNDYEFGYKNIVSNARKFMTWHKVFLFMCKVCSNFWLSVVLAIVLTILNGVHLFTIFTPLLSQYLIKRY